jgi:predicted nucleic acid-binding protein
MRPKVYIETTIVSYLTSRKNRTLIVSAQQEATRRWWRLAKGGFELFASQLVVDEAALGDEAAAEKRLRAIANVSLLVFNDAARLLSKQLVERNVLPRRAAEDAAHLAIATVHGMDYLLTWNCRHLANAALRKVIEQTCKDSGYEPPIIATPFELLEG